MSSTASSTVGDRKRVRSAVHAKNVDEGDYIEPSRADCTPELKVVKVDSQHFVSLTEDGLQVFPLEGQPVQADMFSVHAYGASSSASVWSSRYAIHRTGDAPLGTMGLRIPLPSVVEGGWWAYLQGEARAVVRKYNDDAIDEAGELAPGAVSVELAGVCVSPSHIEVAMDHFCIVEFQVETGLAVEQAIAQGPSRTVWISNQTAKDLKCFMWLPNHSCSTTNVGANVSILGGQGGGRGARAEARCSREEQLGYERLHETELVANMSFRVEMKMNLWGRWTSSRPTRWPQLEANVYDDGERTWKVIRKCTCNTNVAIDGYSDAKLGRMLGSRVIRDMYSHHERRDQTKAK
ncbi:hypothetical protein AB1Y20_008554 [Prymnesium parvum]|uniref:Uncharacterized protein n=1 Tax=Prymnesium parvum TaxID=97485 RepID=A0AB34ITP6_PRYPA